MLRNTSSRLSILAAAVAAMGIGSFVRADTIITDFTPGDLVVLRGGDATNPDTTASTNQVAVYLDEYTTAGAYVGTVDVPSTGAAALTIPAIGDFEHQGVLSDSTDGNYLSFAGYNVPAGSPNANTQSGADQPVIGVVAGSASSLNTSTVVNSYGPGSTSPYIRGAITNGGANQSSLSFWTFGKYAASGATSDGGLAYVSGGTTTTVEGFADWRDIINYNGQTYGGTGSSSVGAHGPYVVGNTVTGSGQITTPVTEPTTNLGNSLANNTLLGSYAGGQSASALAFADLPSSTGTQNGADVMYTIGDQGTPGIVKYYWNGSAWATANLDVALNLANNVVNPVGLIAAPDPTNPNWIDLTVSGSNGIYTYVDQGGYDGAIPTNAFTDLVTPSGNEAFYGIATAVPEPASVGLIAFGAMGLLARRRARKA